MRAQTMVHVGNNSVIRILSLDLSRPVANPRAVRKVQPHLLTPADGRASATRQRLHKYGYETCTIHD